LKSKIAIASIKINHLVNFNTFIIY